LYPVRASGYCYLASVLGLLLLTTAALKTHAAFTETAFDAGLLSSRWVILAIAEFEFFLGGWLITGVYSRLARRGALMTFLCFLCISLVTAFSGERSCSCFGALEVSPGIAATIDCTALIALLLYEPAANASTNTFSPLWCAFLVVYPVALLSLSIALAVSGDPSSPLLLPSKHVVDLGVLSPGEWQNSSLSLTNEGAMPVEIETISSTCPCLSLQCIPPVVPPSGTAQLNATLDLGKEPSFVGNLRIHVQGRTRSGALAFSMQVIAKVRKPQFLPPSQGAALSP
jgi:hypothetical protein